jgi:hypothetical protein
LSEFAVPNYGNFGGTRDGNLFKNVARSRQGLYEHRSVVTYRIRQLDQISRGKRKVLCECAVATLNSQHGSVGTVSGISLQAQSATSASGVDFSYDTSPDQRGIRRLKYTPNELMTWRSPETGIAFHDLEISIADTGANHPDKRLALAARNLRVVHQFQICIESESFHVAFRLKQIRDSRALLV